MKSFSEFLIEMIRKREGKFVVLDSKGSPFPIETLVGFIIQTQNKQL